MCLSHSIHFIQMKANLEGGRRRGIGTIADWLPMPQPHFLFILFFFSLFLPFGHHCHLADSVFSWLVTACAAICNTAEEKKKNNENSVSSSLDKATISQLYFECADEYYMAKICGNLKNCMAERR